MHRASMARPAVRMCPPNVEDRTGVRRGSLTVVGFHGYRQDQSGRTQWTVRCDCGAYDIRSGRALRRLNMDDRCGFCNVEENAFKQEFIKANGRYPDYYEMPTRKTTRDKPLCRQTTASPTSISRVTR